MDGEPESGPVETMEADGKTLEVVPKAPRPPSRTTRQNEVVLELYRRLAAMLPTEGRDYSFSVSFNGTDPRPSIRMLPRNELGRIWCNYAFAEFKKMANGRKQGE